MIAKLLRRNVIHLEYVIEFIERERSKAVGINSDDQNTISILRDSVIAGTHQLVINVVAEISHPLFDFIDNGSPVIHFR